MSLTLRRPLRKLTTRHNCEKEDWLDQRLIMLLAKPGSSLISRGVSSVVFASSFLRSFTRWKKSSVDLTFSTSFTNWSEVKNVAIDREISVQVLVSFDFKGVRMRTRRRIAEPFVIDSLKFCSLLRIFNNLYR